MLDILVVFVFCWLLLKVMGLFFRMAWGTAKIIASLLLGLAVPLLIGCLMFAGGIMLLLPLGLIAGAFGLLKSCAS